jgi:hypothetical protein
MNFLKPSSNFTLYNLDQLRVYMKQTYNCEIM